jgi:hypothetical protein
MHGVTTTMRCSDVFVLGVVSVGLWTLRKFEVQLYHFISLVGWNNVRRIYPPSQAYWCRAQQELTTTTPTPISGKWKPRGTAPTGDSKPLVGQLRETYIGASHLRLVRCSDCSLHNVYALSNKAHNQTNVIPPHELTHCRTEAL